MRDAIKKDPLTFAFATFAEATVALAEDLEPFREEIEEWVKEERDAEEIADAAWGKRQDQIDDGDEP